MNLELGEDYAKEVESLDSRTSSWLKMTYTACMKVPEQEEAALRISSKNRIDSLA